MGMRKPGMPKDDREAASLRNEQALYSIMKLFTQRMATIGLVTGTGESSLIGFFL